VPPTTECSSIASYERRNGTYEPHAFGEHLKVIQLAVVVIHEPFPCSEMVAPPPFPFGDSADDGGTWHSA
jgi:hypothetical protein